VTPTNTCLDAETLAAWLDGGLSPTEAAKAEAHVSSCERCQEILGLIVKTTPVPAATTPWWRQFRAGWLVPLTAGVAAVGLWMIVPNRSAVVQPTAPPAAAVTQLSEANSVAKSQASPAAAPKDRRAARMEAPAREVFAQRASAREATSPDGSVRWRITDAGGLERSTTAGTSWDAVQTGISGELASVRATGARTVIVTTVDGRAFQTTDAGATWTRR
jgi:hypothetical protein